MLETLGPLDPLSQSHTASRFQRGYLQFTQSLDKLWTDLGAESPRLDDFLEAASFKTLIAQYSALAEMLANDQYWTLPLNYDDLPELGDDVRYTISNGMVDGTLVTLVFPVPRSVYPDYRKVGAEGPSILGFEATEIGTYPMHFSHVDTRMEGRVHVEERSAFDAGFR